MPFGAELGAHEARFRLWAPNAKRVVLKAQSPKDGELQADLSEAGEGWFELKVTGFDAGAQYAYRIDDEIDGPDPASRFNPRGAEGRGMLIDSNRFQWSDEAWRGRPWSEAVVYELHVGCFTPQGTYAAASERLDDLAAMGVTAIELMPLATFPGARGWGYDGVLPFAPHHAYGGPDDLKRFIQEAHARGLMVLLDVVYNHFGPQGNYLPRYAPEFFTGRYRTPWGDAINFAHPVVRQFFIHNALYWLNEYSFDGLRIDAVHAMYDDSAVHFIDELTQTVQQGPGRERHVHLVLENERNEARRLSGRALANPRPHADEGATRLSSSASPLTGEGGTGASERLSAVRHPGAASGVAQWNDDFHHALHVIITNERDGYYVDYAERPLEHLGRVLAQGFAYQGERSTFSGHERGEPSSHLSPTAFVNFLQNHDQVGNRAFGERLAQLATVEHLRAAYAILLLSPQIPMLFMGSEYAASQPFLYFCDYCGELADAVRNGRRAEFGRFRAFADEEARATIPDPNAIETFERSRLDWSEREHPPHAQMLEHVRTLLRIRGLHVTARINDVIPGASSFDARGQALHVRWPLRGGGALAMDANLGDAEARIETASSELLYSCARERRENVLRAWEVRLALEP
jgi:1,4-alpha-glucan branching enzyme